MYNDLFSIGKITIHSYGVLIALGYVTAILICYFRAKKRAYRTMAIRYPAMAIVNKVFSTFRNCSLLIGNISSFQFFVLFFQHIHKIRSAFTAVTRNRPAAILGL